MTATGAPVSCDPSPQTAGGPGEPVRPPAGQDPLVMLLAPDGEVVFVDDAGAARLRPRSPAGPGPSPARSVAPRVEGAVVPGGLTAWAPIHPALGADPAPPTVTAAGQVLGWPLSVTAYPVLLWTGTGTLVVWRDLTPGPDASAASSPGRTPTRAQGPPEERLVPAALRRDRHGRVADWSGRAARLFERTAAEMIGASVEVLAPARVRGVGFDRRRADRLFQPFRRRHPDDVAGLGIGLSLVRRIVVRHGGRVRAESEPGVHTTFSFTLET